MSTKLLHWPHRSGTWTPRGLRGQGLRTPRGLRDAQKVLAWPHLSSSWTQRARTPRGLRRRARDTDCFRGLADVPGAARSPGLQGHQGSQDWRGGSQGLPGLAGRVKIPSQKADTFPHETLISRIRRLLDEEFTCRSLTETLPLLGLAKELRGRCETVVQSKGERVPK